MTTLFGDTGNNVLNGTEANDTLIGSSGNDTLDGNDGIDTADYSSLDEAITLERAGIVNKGSNGNDQLINIETIIGAAGERNAIDGSTGTSGVTSFYVDLSQERLVVNDLPFDPPTNLTFTVQNFVDVTGTTLSDTLVGNDLGNSFVGGAGNDVLKGRGGDDEIWGENGDDLLKGGNGDDTLLGGNDEDEIFGEGGNDSVQGGNGDDTVFGSVGNDSIFGSPGNDRLSGDEGDDLINGDDGDDRIFGGIGEDTVSGNEGNDEIFAQAGNDVVSGGNGNDTLFGRGGIDTLDGGNGNDTVNGGSRNDILLGSKGNDTLNGDSGNKDTADYSSLDEAITLERAGTVNKGSSGTDQILGIETIIGAAGERNAIDGSTGTSGVTSFSINLGTENLVVRDIPGLGDVTFSIENFVDVTGTDRADGLAGNSSNNRLNGGGGNDGITGADGNDTLIGGSGTDFLVGGGDADTLIGGLGEADNFRYNSISDSTPTSRDIVDFEADFDSITLSPIDADLSIEGTQAFTFIGSNPFSGGGQVRYDAESNLIQAQAIGSDQLLEIESSVSFNSLSESNFDL